MKHFVLSLAGMTLLSAAVVAAQDAKQVDAGKQLFTSKGCSKCHQVAGRGNKANVLDGVASKVSVADMKKWLTNPAEMEAKLDHKPKIKMSSKKAALTNSDIDSLVAYLETLK
jgi:mono/diheme cytochrome c family protein